MLSADALWPNWGLLPSYGEEEIDKSAASGGHPTANQRGDHGGGRQPHIKVYWVLHEERSGRWGKKAGG